MASALSRFVLPQFLKLNTASNRLSFKINRIPPGFFGPVSVAPSRLFRKSYGMILRVMKKRREVAGPEKLRRRNEWDNWNYKSELFAFNQRLHENMTEDTLRWAFVHESYIKMEEQKRLELDLPSQDVQLDLKSNDPLAELGLKITSSFITRYLRHCYSLLPEEGISALHDYLLSDEVTSHISSNIGTTDLIFSVEYPPAKSTLSRTLFAIIGAIASDADPSRAETFVLDFLCPQLIGKDVFEIWDLKNPLETLNSILLRHGFEECEPRLIFESGRNTIEAVYHVGLYSDKKFLGRGPGETLNMATEMAAIDCLRKMFLIKENEQPNVLGHDALKVEFNKVVKHPSIVNWYYDGLRVRA